MDLRDREGKASKQVKTKVGWKGAVEREVADQDLDLDVAAARGGSDCPSGSLSLREGSKVVEPRFNKGACCSHAPLPNSISKASFFTLSHGRRGGTQSSARERAEGASGV